MPSNSSCAPPTALRAAIIRQFSFACRGNKLPQRLTADGRIKLTLPDGKSEEREVKAGQSVWNQAGKHLHKNLTDKPFEVVLIEMKSK